MARFLKIALVCALPFVVLVVCVVGETPPLQDARCITIDPSVCGNTGNAVCEQILKDGEYDYASCTGACRRCNTSQTIPKRSCVRWYGYTCPALVGGEIGRCREEEIIFHDQGTCRVDDWQCQCDNYQPTATPCNEDEEMGYYECK